MTSRLCAATLASVPSHVARPRYTPSEHGIGIVHIGLGAFHRAHQAVYVDDVLATAGGDWRIVGVSLRSSSVRDQLVSQDGLYTLVVRDGGAEQLRVIGSIADVLVASERPEAVIAALTDPGVAIVSLTITEKGYCCDLADSALDFGHPDIIHDLANGDHPRSAIGFLVAGIAARRAAEHGPLTILSCDNLPDNGRMLERLVRAFASAAGSRLDDWIDANVRFPSTMVDRIVPATTTEARTRLSSELGMTDAAMVTTEPFTQWVVENRFAGRRPCFERVGVQLVDDVRPYERAKLRLLNAGHSALAYFGRAIGYDYVSDAIDDPVLRSLVHRLMTNEAAPVLEDSDKLDVVSYIDALFARFGNTALNHRLDQIAIDGSNKLPQRIIATILERRARETDAPVARLVVAAWIAYVTDSRFRVDDPMKGVIEVCAEAAAGDIDMPVRTMLKLSLFGALGQDEAFVVALIADVAAFRDDPAACLLAAAKTAV